jgi:hypothetical protein
VEKLLTTTSRLLKSVLQSADVDVPPVDVDAGLELPPQATTNVQAAKATKDLELISGQDIASLKSTPPSPIDAKHQRPPAVVSMLGREEQ